MVELVTIQYMSTKEIGELLSVFQIVPSIQIIQFLMNREYPSRFKEIVRHGERTPSTILTL